MLQTVAFQLPSGLLWCFEIDLAVSVVVIGFQIDALAHDNEYTTCRDILVCDLNMRSFLNMFHPYPCPHAFLSVSHAGAYEPVKERATRDHSLSIIKFTVVS